MKKVKAIVLAYRIEYHWWAVKQAQKRAERHRKRMGECEKGYQERYAPVFGGVL